MAHDVDIEARLETKQIKQAVNDIKSQLGVLEEFETKMKGVGLVLSTPALVGGVAVGATFKLVEGLFEHIKSGIAAMSKEEDKWASVNDRLSTKMADITASLEELEVALGDNFIDVAKDAADVLIQITDAVQDLAPAVKQFLIDIGFDRSSNPALSGSMAVTGAIAASLLGGSVGAAAYGLTGQRGAGGDNGQREFLREAHRNAAEADRMEKAAFEGEKARELDLQKKMEEFDKERKETLDLAEKKEKEMQGKLESFFGTLEELLKMADNRAEELSRGFHRAGQVAGGGLPRLPEMQSIMETSLESIYDRIAQGAAGEGEDARAAEEREFQIKAQAQREKTNLILDDVKSGIKIIGDKIGQEGGMVA